MNPPTERPPHPTVAAWVRTLLARFDGMVLRVAPPASTGTSLEGAADHQGVFSSLQAWCFAGAGDGRSPLVRPWVLPRVDQRFAVARFAQGAANQLAPYVDAFARHIDGTDQLAAAGGRWAELCLRLRVKLNDAAWWRARQPADPWDAGYLIGEPQDWQGFQPRRATLMLVEVGGLSDAALREALRILNANSAGYRHPVRVLVLGRHIDAITGSSAPGPALAITEIAWPYSARTSISAPSAMNTPNSAR
ncbi:hypothetical protein [Hydrogenophaga sp.]|uniref:hypothetical protein n=1 Tax=Hydrogenophaga sp. TaxID=1904254 RepID=UPI00271B6AA4|nr:hypothetical protein [Hydrogenophaga sp.]MDO9435490.1 hypothetical protein [Hydrogenophaga sp.]